MDVVDLSSANGRVPLITKEPPDAVTQDVDQKQQAFDGSTVYMSAPDPFKPFLCLEKPTLRH